MNRRDVMKLAVTQSALVAWPGAMTSASAQASDASPAITVRNTQFELVLRPGAGLGCRLVHRLTGAVMAEGPYSYSFGTPVFGDVRQEGATVVLQGRTEYGVDISHRFTVDPAESWVEEEIELSNSSAVPIDLHDVRAGFVLPVAFAVNEVQGPWARCEFTAIPFRREPSGRRSQYSDFSLSQILTQQCSSELWSGDTTITPGYASEAWAWMDGKRGYLISKFSPGGLEFAILDRTALPQGNIGLRWGGIGIYRGIPEHGAWLQPGESYRFGVTRITAFDGDRLQGFYTFRAEMEGRGLGCPRDFNPPVHWNELYDNKLWWLPNEGQNDPEMRKKYYTLESMKEEAAKAKAIGCEALYLDPGWDTNFGSKIWDEARLTPYKAFTAMLAKDYGLKSSLHTPLSGWCDPSSYPVEAYRLDRFGNRAAWDRSIGISDAVLCGASEQYLAETAKRLKALARDGAAFFMFDGTAYREECWDPNHGHKVPARLEEHCQATCRLARMVHAEFPSVLIEMHDPAAGGAPQRNCPIYYGYGPCFQGQGTCPAPGFDAVWAFELMWKPMENLLSGQSIALYYYNLAYSIPLYIHIDLRTDNQNAIVFWWNASTCRHLGIGGTHPDEAVRRVQAQSVASYRRLKHYFASGVFYGIDEQTHIHSAGDGKSAVMNCFNLDDHLVEREIRFDPKRFGLSPDKSYEFSGAAFSKTGGAYVGVVRIPARGHILVEIQ
jgi:hypothetical protein